jgi:NadR type nicotinamide-nucleotide adenylyltransferase
MTTGFILGKFLPPHRGHLYLIEQASQQVDKLTVLVCSLVSEPIAGELRVRWLRELFPHVDFHHCTDENPSYPHEHPDFWNIWLNSVRKFVPLGPEVVFSSEMYGDELAARLGARHVLIDLERKTFPISGTAVRENPYAHWEMLPPPVRAYYVRKVTFAGAESTGKTTLSLPLAVHFNTTWLPEYGRLYVEQVRSCEDQMDMDNIARGQAQLEQAGARQANRLLVCDTDVLVSLIWQERYFVRYPEWMNQLYESQPSHLYLLCDLDVPWVADRIRDSGSEERRKWFHRRFIEEFERRGLPYVLLSGSPEQRWQKAVEAVEQHFPFMKVS